jgi:hypothetical protein
MALQRKWMPSPNVSGRGGVAVRCIVFHTTEGAQDITSLGNFFGSSSVQASSHVGIDNKTRGTIGEYVRRADKAWTQGNANPYCVSAEMCGPSGMASNWSRDYWLNNQRTLLDNAAEWLAEEAKFYGIPLTILSASAAQGSGRGVCQHRDFGSMGGGHHDAGNGFPIDYVVQKAGGVAVAPPPASSGGGGTAPKLNVDWFGTTHNSGHPDVRTWQQQMKNRGWNISVDQQYGPGSESACRGFQQDKGLAVDGKVGQQTWSMTWTAPIT